MTIKYVLFDLDGTLVQSEQGIYDCTINAFDRLGLARPTRQQIVAAIGYDFNTTFLKLAPDQDSSKAQDFQRYFLEAAPQYLTKGTALLPHVEATLSTLRNQHYSLGLVTTKFRREVDALFNQYSTILKFAASVAGDETAGRNKPDPAPLNKVLEALNTHRECAIYLGDSIVDAEAAKFAGLPFIGVLTGSAKQEDFTPFWPICVLPDLAHLPLILKLLALESRIYDTVVAVGGYWAPEFGTLRIVEEHGELVDAIVKGQQREIAEEAADVLFITSCVLKQYGGHAASAWQRFISSPRRQTISAEIICLEISSFIGQIARIINFYDGPKGLKPSETLKRNLQETITEVHYRLLELADLHHFDLLDALSAKIDKIISRDQGRFEVSLSDPTQTSTRAIVASKLNVHNIYMPYLRHWWAAKAYPSSYDHELTSLEEYVQKEISNLFKRFATACRFEQIHMLSIVLPSQFSLQPRQVIQKLFTGLQQRLSSIKMLDLAIPIFIFQESRFFVITTYACNFSNELIVMIIPEAVLPKNFSHPDWQISTLLQRCFLGRPRESIAGSEQPSVKTDAYQM